MAGGNWNSQSKTLPGAYVDVYSSKSATLSSENLRGVVFTSVSGLNWGQRGVVRADLSTDFLALFGKSIDDPALLGLKMILQNARTAYVFNLNSGTAATGTSNVLPWSFAAKYPGTLGNSISVAITPDPSNLSRFIVKTILGTEVVASQTVAKASELVANGYLVPTVNASDTTDDGAAKLSALVTGVTVKLENGTTDASSSLDDFVVAAETYEYNTIAAPMSAAGASIQTLIASTAIRLRDERTQGASRCSL